jgi:hypothetical protein
MGAPAALDDASLALSHRVRCAAQAPDCAIVQSGALVGAEVRAARFPVVGGTD